MKFCLLTIAACMCVLAGIAMLNQWELQQLQKQAIERGHAEYVVDSDGKTTWQWKDK